MRLYNHLFAARAFVYMFVYAAVLGRAHLLRHTFSHYSRYTVFQWNAGKWSRFMLQTAN